MLLSVISRLEIITYHIVAVAASTLKHRLIRRSILQNPRCYTLGYSVEHLQYYSGVSPQENAGKPQECKPGNSLLRMAPVCPFTIQRASQLSLHSVFYPYTGQESLCVSAGDVQFRPRHSVLNEGYRQLLSSHTTVVVLLRIYFRYATVSVLCISAAETVLELFLRQVEVERLGLSTSASQMQRSSN